MTDYKRLFNELTHKYIEYRTGILLTGEEVPRVNNIDRLYANIKHNGLTEENVNEFQELLHEAINEWRKELHN